MGGRWCVQYAYDQFGNGWTPSKSGLALGLAQASSNWYLQSSGAVNNRLKDVAYDASGRQRQWKVGDTSSVAVYDPEGHMTEAKGDSVVTPGTEKIYGSYLYNGDGQRVKSVADGKTVWYVYGLDGGVAAEFATGYTNVNAGKTLYPVTDHLGSTRAWFDQTGTVTQRVDYEPFGGEIQRAGVAGYSGVGDPAQKFTGKERDAETGLDYFGARYLMAGQGRFGSPDPLMESGNPQNGQSWNRYAYTYNNPLRFVDPNGMCSGPPLQAGEMGVCIDLYIAAPKIGVIGEGDNRGPAPNDPKATYRQELQLALNPKTGGVRVVKDDPGVSEVLVVPDELGKLSPTLAAKGTSSTSVSPTTTDKQGNHHFAIYNEALNGIASIPILGRAAPQETIKTDVKFVFTPDGKVGLDPGGTRTAYPSIEIYRYDRGGKPTTLLQQKESGKPADLCCRNQVIPRVSPR